VERKRAQDFCGAGDKSSLHIGVADFPIWDCLDIKPYDVPQIVNRTLELIDSLGAVLYLQKDIA
jgi:hypothetical protein